MNIADQYFATEGFFRMFGIKFLEGSEPSGPRDIAISRSCAGQLGAAAGWKDGAVGKQVLMTEHSGSGDDVFTICGIYEDYLIGSFNNPDTRPSVRFWAEKPSGYVWFDYLLIKSSGVNQSLTASIENTVRDIVGGEREIEVLSYEEQMDSLYSDNRKNRDTFIIGCIYIVPDITDNSNHRYAHGLCLPGDTDYDLAPQRLAIDLALSCEDEIRIARNLIELGHIENRLDTHLKLAIEEGLHTASHTASSTASRNGLQIYSDILLDKLGKLDHLSIEVLDHLFISTLLRAIDSCSTVRTIERIVDIAHDSDWKSLNACIER